VSVTRFFGIGFIGDCELRNMFATGKKWGRSKEVDFIPPKILNLKK
jgi:hypothetical protein